jgi:hypothetical protein
LLSSSSDLPITRELEVEEDCLFSSSMLEMLALIGWACDINFSVALEIERVREVFSGHE